MSTIAWPTNVRPSGFSLVLKPVQRGHSSPFGGSEQVVDLLNDRWYASLELHGTRTKNGGQVEGFIASLRGMTNTVALWHMARPIPKGTMRGSPLISGSHSQGAATLSISSAGALATLKQGDMLGASGLLVMVASDCTADGSGNISVPIANRLRTALTNGTAVTWSRPTCAFRCISPTGVGYSPGIANAVNLDFVEYIA